MLTSKYLMPNHGTPTGQLTIALVAPSLDVLGGQGIQAQALAQALRRDGYTVNFVPINPRFPKYAQRLRGYRYVRTLLNEALYISSLWQLRQADIVHIFAASYWSFLLAPIPAILAAKLLHKPVILHYHSGEADDHLSRWRSVAPFLRMVDHIVVPSLYLQSVFQSHHHRAIVIPNVIDTSQYPYREQTPLRPFLLSVRNLESHYRVENTVHAFARLKARFPEATLTIVGCGSNEQRLRRLVEHLRVTGIRFVGRVEPAALPAFYDAADIFVNSSIVDNQPVSILEAFAAGLPVVSTPTGDIPAMLRGGEAGLLVAPEDPSAMADTITRLLEDPDLASRIVRNARSEVERHTWPAIRELWTTLYSDLHTGVAPRPRRGTRLRRLLHMDAPELASRSRQQVLKWGERVGAFTHQADRSDSLSLDQFVQNADELFFKGLFDRQVPAALAIGAAQQCKDLVATAEKICRGRFDLLGYSNLDFGSPPDWQFDPISERRAPRVHWTRLDPLDYTTVGDSKVIWEFNRHQWLVHLGQAYRLTHEERYAEAVVFYLRNWLDNNPPGIGINWTSSLEVALRLIAWCWALVLIHNSSALTPSFFEEIAASIQWQATHIERYLSHYFSPNTHLTGEALGLLYAGLLFPQWRHAERWRSLATHILNQEIDRQVLSDGVYFELSTCYQRYTVDTYLHFLILASRAGLEVPSAVSERVRSMLDFLVTVRHPDGSLPSIGDADGGWLLPLSRTRPDDFRAMFSTAAVLFKDPTYAAAARQLAPDTLWLMGTAAVEIFEALPTLVPASDACRTFTVGGFCVMRSGWDEDSQGLIFDTGPLGCRFSSGHGHADLLSVQCSVFGRPFIVDAGTCCYGANKELRDFSRGTLAHSTVVVDGKSQAEPAGPFTWQNRSAARLLRWFSNQTLAFADAEHDAYRALPDPVSHRRRVIFVKPRYWVVVDDLTGSGLHRVEIRFQFAPMEVRIDSDGWARATLDGQHGLALRPFAVEQIEAEVRVGCRAPLEGWVSPNYGQLEPAPVLVYTASTSVPLRIVTLLWPSEDIEAEAPCVKVIHDSRGRVAGLEFPELAETVVFKDGGPSVERTRPVTVAAS
jgi:glycosyltransferase involved in cell wall biosynthesis